MLTLTPCLDGEVFETILGGLRNSGGLGVWESGIWDGKIIL